MKRSLHTPLLALCIATIISACGGSSSSPAGATSITATIQGKAAKGIIIEGNIVANELNSDGSVKNANVGSATTDITGRYSIITNSSYQGGPIEVTVTANSNTKMVCDAVSGCGTASDATLDSNSNGTVDFGEQYKPASLNMSAMLPDAGQGETIDVQITPFTHMAAQRARALAGAAGGSLNSTVIAQANSAISNMLGGVNILRTEPVDITDINSLSSADVTAIAYAALSAAIAELADDDATTGEPELDQELAELASEFEDGTFSADILGTIVSGATNSLNQTTTSDTSGVLSTIQTTVTSAGTGGSVTPIPSASAGDSNIEKAYAFITDLRTWGTVIGNEIDNPSLAFENQIDLADRVYDSINGSIGDGISAAFDAIGNVSDGIQTSTDLTQHNIFGGSFTAGTVTRTEDPSGFDIYTVSNAIFEPTLNSTNPATVNMVVHAPRNNTQVGPGAVTYGIQSITANDSTATLNVTAGDIVIDLASAYTPDFTAINPVNPDINSIAFDMQASLTQDKTVNSTGQVIDAADPVTFTGNITMTVYPYQDANGEILDGLPSNIGFSGNVANTTGDSLDASFTASLPNAASLTPSNDVLAIGSTYASNHDSNINGVEDLNEHLAYWQYTDVDALIPGVDTFTGVSPFNTLIASLNQNGSATISGSSFPSPVIDPGPYTSIQNWVAANAFQFPSFFGDVFVPDEGLYQQVVSQTPPDLSVDGFIAFSLLEPEVNFNLESEPGSVGLQFTAQLSGLPEAVFSITGNKTGFDAGNATVTISYGTRSISFNASASPNTNPPVGTFMDGSGTLTITNSDGVALALQVNASESASSDNLTGSVTIDGVEIASIAETSTGLTKVTYNDGTFELF